MRFQRKTAVSPNTTGEKATIGRPDMEGGINDQLADPPTKKPTRMKRARAFVRGCFRAVAGCFGVGCKVNDRHQETEDWDDVLDIYRRCSSHGRPAPVSDTEYEIDIETSTCDVHIETLSTCEVQIETPSTCEIHIETSPTCEDQIETPPTEAQEIVPMGLEGFRFHCLLGEGGYGRVVLASHTSTDTLLAVKIMMKSDDTDESKGALRESFILEKVHSSPFCTQAYGTFQTKDNLFFVMEYLSGGDLRKFISARAPVDIATARFLTAELICELRFLHASGIVHRDLKPNNILLDSTGHVKIADFGISAVDLEGSKIFTSMAGSPTYTAPEMFQEDCYSFSIDYFSLGVIVYEMTTGKFPFPYQGSYERLIDLICNHDPSFPVDFDEDLKDLIGNKLLCKCPETREKHVENLRSHPFFQTIDWVELEAGKVNPPFTMEKCPPICLETELKLEDITAPIDEGIELTEEDQMFYYGFSYTSSRWGELQRCPVPSAPSAEETPIIQD